MTARKGSGRAAALALRTAIEQHIAQGWPLQRIANQLGTDLATVRAVHTRMDEACTEDDTPHAVPPRRLPAPDHIERRPSPTPPQPDLFTDTHPPRDLLTDTVCPVGHAIYTVDDLDHDARCVRCEREMRAERRALAEAARNRAGSTG